MRLSSSHALYRAGEACSLSAFLGISQAFGTRAKRKRTEFFSRPERPVGPASVGMQTIQASQANLTERARERQQREALLSLPRTALERELAGYSRMQPDGLSRAELVERIMRLRRCAA